MDEEEIKRKRDPQRVRLLSQPAIGTVPVENRWGGNKPLHVMKLPQRANLMLMPWSFPPAALQLIQRTKGRVFVTVTLDLNAEGMPAMSVDLQPYRDAEASAVIKAVHQNREAALKAGGTINLNLPPAKKLILPGS
jgi:hypothetical protein